MGIPFFMPDCLGIPKANLSRVGLCSLYVGLIHSLSCIFLQPTLGKREITFGPSHPSPKKVILVFPPVVTKTTLDLHIAIEVCNQHSGRREITFYSIKK